MCGFTAQLVERGTAIAEVMGSKNGGKIYCDDHSSLSFTTAVQIWISYIFHIVCILLQTLSEQCSKIAKKTAIRVTVQKIREGGITPN